MRGILFKPEMIKAINELRKTVTRRLDGLKEINEHPDEWIFKGVASSEKFCEGKFWFQHQSGERDEYIYNRYITPRYHAGEVVYVKEAWAVDALWDDRKPSEIDPHASVWYPTNADLMNMPLWVGKLRTPMFLREIHARTFLEITDVRPERLWEITEEDAKLEGMPITDAGYRYIYSVTWDKINGKNKVYWNTNPWVWRIEFKRVTREIANG